MKVCQEWNKKEKQKAPKIYRSIKEDRLNGEKKQEMEKTTMKGTSCRARGKRGVEWKRF